MSNEEVLPFLGRKRCPLKKYFNSHWSLFLFMHYNLDTYAIGIGVFFCCSILLFAAFEFLRSVLVEHLQPRHERLRYGLPNPDVC